LWRIRVLGRFEKGKIERPLLNPIVGLPLL
jgi:hypothetical protein